MNSIAIEDILRELSFVSPELSSFVHTEDFILPLAAEDRAHELLRVARQSGASVHYSSESGESGLVWRDAYFSGPTELLIRLLEGLRECRSS